MFQRNFVLLTLSFYCTGVCAGDTALLHWLSERRTPAEVTQDVAKLYRVLLDFDVLPTKPIIDNVGLTPQELLRSHGGAPGEGFPINLDITLCQLNPKLCIADSGIESLNSANIHIRWTNKSGDTLILPNVRFRIYRSPQLYDKQAGQKLERIVVNDRQGCQNFDKSCRTSLRRMNSRAIDPFKASYAGPVVVPTLAVSAKIDVTALSYEKREELRKTLGDTVVIDIVPTLQQGPPTREPLYGEQSGMFKLINHPFAYGQALVGNYPPEVAIIDNWVDPSHPEFTASEEHRVQIHNLGNRDHRKKCDENIIDGTLAVDHGTHITGIVAAALNGIGIAGTDPSARVVAYGTNDSSIDPPNYAINLAATIQSAVVDHGADIFNFSISYDLNPTSDGADPVQNRIETYRNAKLFVAAAGNDNSDLSRLCPMRPTCLKLPNVLVVGAVSNNGNLKRWITEKNVGSNYGGVVHVAAPGDRIVSTIAGGCYGRMSGTSQATPLVTAAAAALLTKDNHLYPEQIRDRLIYSSNLNESIEKEFLGGLLDFRRALDFENDVVVYRPIDSKENKPLEERGQVRTDMILYFDSEGETGQSVKLLDVLRIVRNADGKTYTLFHRATQYDQTGINLPIKRTGVNFTEGTNRDIVLRQGRESKSFKILQLDDYIRCLKCQ